MSWKGPEYEGDFPSLGYLIGDWVQRHCVIPDGFDAGRPFVFSNEQLAFVVHHYRLKLGAHRGQLAPAFVYRRSQLVRPQKWGKNPMIAAQICAEAVGPVLFAGWARDDEAWVCSEHACECGWVYEYEPGEPMGMAWPTSLIQITATSEDQTDNTYDALRPMIDNGPLREVIIKTGEEFIRLPNGRIDIVTSNARSRLGQRVTFVPQDETGLWLPITGMLKVAHTQRRGLAGMGGRSVEITNAWDPSENSLAQQTYESGRPDIYKDYRIPPVRLSYRNKAERRKVHRFNYEGSPWVDVDAIEGEAAELLEFDPAQAERFFGNRLVAGAGNAFELERWNELVDVERHVEPGSLITIGVKGARFADAMAIVATDVTSGHQWPLGIWERPKDAPDDYEHPAAEITGAITEAFERFEPWRAYIDPQYIEYLVDGWRGKWGEKRVIEWFTHRPRAMAFAVRAYRSAQTAGDLSHDGDGDLARHIGNARKQPVNVKDDEGRPMWTLQKERAGSPLEIAGAIAGVLSWEARGDAIAAGATKRRARRVAAY